MPELVKDFPDLSGYEQIFIGGPIWDGYISTPLMSYLSQVDFSGKIIFPFCTSIDSGIKSYANDFAAHTKNPLKICELLNITFPGNSRPDAFSSSELDAKLRGWISQSSALTLNSGYKMPVIGIGTWTLSDAEAEKCTYEAIKYGYRLFDTARYYGTEAGVGRAVRKAIDEGLVTRDEIFITTKIVPSGNVDYASLIEECNKKISLGYIDLMLIHQSGAGDEKLYRAMENAVKKGTLRSIGISTRRQNLSELLRVLKLNRQ